MELSLELREDLHAVEADENLWPLLLTRLADALGANEATFGGGQQWESPRIFAPRTDSGYVGVYLDTYHQQNAFMQAMLRNSMLRVVAGFEMPEFEDLQQTDFYHLWCRPQGFSHMFGFSLASVGGWSGTLAINLANAPERNQMARLSALLPHIQRLVDGHVLVNQLRSSMTSTLSTLAVVGSGAVLLDRHGRILELNPLAEEILTSGCLRIFDGRLRADGAGGADAFYCLLHACLTRPDHAGGKVELVGACGSVSVHCAPFAGSVAFPAPQRPAVIVILTDPQQQFRHRLREVQARYGLTQAEAELAEAVFRAGNRKTAAALRGVTDATARAQLSSIFDKTGVRRQTDLIRLLTNGN